MSPQCERHGTGLTTKSKLMVFKPFLRRKSRQGHCLGLATCPDLVQQSASHWHYTEVGNGTAFKIYFPRIDEPFGLRPNLSNAALPSWNGNLAGLEDEAS